jgi:chromosome segregation ATPase
LPTTLDDSEFEITKVDEEFKAKTKELQQSMNSIEQKYKAEADIREKELQCTQAEISGNYDRFQEKDSELKRARKGLKKELKNF